ncbi:MAG: EscU/YscU/HrcU family type III secretion system export apparatus switch protein, partial [Bacteroidales bacterium]|nr:EscU/YscU/HrcU family type III secretion system export apparatus switch protein [Bacteroidales bacterium]
VMLGGFTFSSEAMKLRWDALNPASNIKNLMNMQSIVTLILSVFKVGIVSLIIWFYLRDRIESLSVLRWATPAVILSQIAKMIVGMSIRIIIALLFITLVDVLFQYFKYMKDMRMSMTEVKQENKDTEGSPELRARIRSIRMQMLREQMKEAVPQADVVLVNPTHYAVALKYDPESMSAPMLLAKGVDHKAQTIREIARAYGVPIVRRPELARTIYGTVDVGSSVPEGLYMAVAEVLAVIYRLRQQKANR